MTAALQKYHQVILTSLPNATFSLELEGGQLLLDLPVGQTINLFGQDHRLASLSVLPESKQGKTTSDISGPCSSISSRSKRLQQSLVNKLQVQLGTDGSTIYKKTWRNKTTPAQWPYCQLAASAHRTKGKGCGSWPTPSTRDHKGGYIGGRMRNGKLSTDTLDVTAQLSSWPTPNTMDVIDRNSIRPSRAATNRTSGYLTEDILHLNENPRGVPPSGMEPQGHIAGTISTAPSQLNPRFSLWLMGYPTEWAYCAERVTPLSRKSGQK